MFKRAMIVFAGLVFVILATGTAGLVVGGYRGTQIAIGAYAVGGTLALSGALAVWVARGDD